MKILFTCLISLAFCCPALAQDDSFQGSGTVTDADPLLGSTDNQGSSKKGSASKSDQTSPKSPEGPKYLEYARILKEIRSVKAEKERLFGSMPIGFPKLQVEHSQKIDLLKKREIVLASQITDAAIAAFRESAEQGVPQNKHVVSLVVQSMVGGTAPKHPAQKFDPKMSLELANLLTNSGLEQPAIYFQAFRAAFAIQDFERAALMLQKIEDLGAKLPESTKTRLNDAKTNWQKELEIRRLEASADDLPKARIETSAGAIDVELFENHAPIAVANFVSLVQKGFYDGQIFHVVKPGILAEAGCPNGNGTGHPGYRIQCECYGEELRHHFIGSLSMSNNGRDTAGSQFFITHQPNPTLDGKYTVFGRVIGDMTPVFQLNTANKTKNTAKNDLNLPPSTITRISIIRKRDHEYEPTTLPREETATGPAPSDGSMTRPKQPVEPAKPIISRNPLLPNSGNAVPSSTRPETPAGGSGTTNPVPDSGSGTTGSGKN